MTTIRHCPSGSPSSTLTSLQQQQQQQYRRQQQQRRPRRLSDRQLIILVLMVATVGVIHTLVLLQHLPMTIPRRTISSSDATRRLTPSPIVIVNHTTQPTITIHAIPRILIFTHYRDLWNDPEDSLTDSEERVMAANIRKVVALHQPSDRHTTTTTTINVTVRFLTDDHCIQSLQRTFPSLIPFFQTERQGMFKADICRGSALYETGGIYLDVDVGVRYDLWKDLRPTTAFVTAQVHGESKYPGHFFQAIMGAAPASPIIYKYLQLFHDHYQGIERVDKGPLGVILLRRAWDRIYNHHNHTPPTELYQEVLYDKKLFPQLHPAPTWGTRRACHFVVVAKANHKSHAEFTLPAIRTKTKQTKQEPQDLCIPLYSRIAGSRMCPIIITHTSSHHNKTGQGGMVADKAP